MDPVSVYCPCGVALSNNKNVIDVVRSRNSFLVELYFCLDCFSIRCEKCSAREVVSLYCPCCLTLTDISNSLLFHGDPMVSDSVITSNTNNNTNTNNTQTKSPGLITNNGRAISQSPNDKKYGKGYLGKNIGNLPKTCTRNCLLCPRCFIQLSVLAADVTNNDASVTNDGNMITNMGTTTSPTISNIRSSITNRITNKINNMTKDTANLSSTVILKCPYCGWSSHLNSNLEFDKLPESGSLVYQLRKQITIDSNNNFGGKFGGNLSELEEGLEKKTGKDNEKKISLSTSFWYKNLREIGISKNFDKLFSNNLENENVIQFNEENDILLAKQLRKFALNGSFVSNSIYDSDFSTLSQVLNQQFPPRVSFLNSNFNIKNPNTDTNIDVQLPDQLARFSANLIPFPPTLHSRVSRRCKDCRHILVKPDFIVKTKSSKTSSPVSSKFRIKLMAINYIPSLSITPSYFKSKNIKKYYLTIVNPSFEPILLNLSAPSSIHPLDNLSPLFKNLSTVNVTLIYPSVRIGASRDYDPETPITLAMVASSNNDKILDNSNNISNNNQTGLNNSLGKQSLGIVDRGSNWVKLLVEINLNYDIEKISNQKNLDPKAMKTIIYQIPLFVSTTYTIPDSQKTNQVSFWASLPIRFESLLSDS